MGNGIKDNIMEIQEEIIKQKVMIEYLQNIITIKNLKEDIESKEELERRYSYIEPAVEGIDNREPEFIRWEQDKFIKEQDEIDGEEIVGDDVYNKIEVLDSPEKRLEALRESIRIQNLNDMMLKQRMEEAQSVLRPFLPVEEPYSPKEPFRWVEPLKHRNTRSKPRYEPRSRRNAKLKGCRSHKHRRNHRGDKR